MKFLFCILRRLVGYLLGVLLVALIAAAATFGWQGYKLYQSAVQATPLETLYQSITARPSFVTYDQLPQTYIDAVLSVAAGQKRLFHPGKADGPQGGGDVCRAGHREALLQTGNF